MMIRRKLFALAFVLMLVHSMKTFGSSKDTISISTLLNEMVSTEEIYTYPNPTYKTLQISSYDRRSVAADQAFWFANGDGHGFMRLDTIDNRIEKVLFEDNGPGVITRIWMTTTRKNGVLRFYFDGEFKPSMVVSAYDLSQFPVYLGDNMNLKHTNYRASGRGGNTLFFPFPYAKSCRVTFEEPDREAKVSRYYQFNYRKYSKNVAIKTATLKEIATLTSKIKAVDNLLVQPQTKTDGDYHRFERKIEKGDNAVFVLDKQKSKVVESLIINTTSKLGDFSKMMQDVKLRITFDGKTTVDLPLAFFAGVGHRASSVLDSWYLTSNGKGNIVCRWPMPFQNSMKVELINDFDFLVDCSIELYSKPIVWTSNTLYFNVNWKADYKLPISKNYDSNSNSHWNFTTINGRGILRADLLSLFNHAPNWYGEGDEKIWIDDDVFPSHFGTGMEDYYNCSWAPVVPFQTAFGGAPTAENPSSHGFNSYYRARHLDAIPFSERIKFDFELLSWTDGFADMTSTVFWYGD